MLQLLFMCTFCHCYSSLVQAIHQIRFRSPTCSHVVSSLCALYRRLINPIRRLFLIGPNMYRRGPQAQAIFDSRR
jgi:fructose-1,6-bisphosphatase